ncbi:MAG: hypothetical protein V4614_15025 [Pseudomonadota bacterium]
MPTLNDTNKEIWQWLFQAGGSWTVSEIGASMGKPSDQVFTCVNAMMRRQLVNAHKDPKGRRLRYGIDGTCLVPQGMRLAEVQA